MQRVLLGFIVIALKILLTQSVSSIPMSNVHIQGLESQNVKLVMMDSTSFSALILYRRQKKIALDQQKNIIMGISQMAYDANRLISSYYHIGLELCVNSLTLTGMQIGVKNNIDDLKSISVSILIISNNYVFKDFILGFKGFYNSTNSYNCIFQTIFATNTSLSIYPFLNGVFIQTYSSNRILNLRYTFATPIISNFTNIKSRVDSLSYQLPAHNVTLRILVIKKDAIPIQETTIKYFVSNGTNNPINQPTYDSNTSQLLMGLSWFYYRPGQRSLTRSFFWQISYPASTSLTFLIDDQFDTFNYIILVFNSYDCNNSSFPFQNTNRTSSPTRQQCFDQCYSNQYQTYNNYFSDYYCQYCHPSCLTCYTFNQCKQCVMGYKLEPNRKCTLNTSYFILSYIYTTKLCSDNFTGCDTCTTYGHKCLTCKEGFYVLSEGMETYHIDIGNSTNPILTPYTVLAVYCNACSSRVPNCLTCNKTVCFTCAPPTQLITPTLCQVPTNQIFSVIQPCTDQIRCKKCLQSALDDCLQCFDSELTLRDGKCMSPCGDGILLDQEICDDGNTLSYDGCSSDCMTVETGWQCQTLPSPSRKSYCHFTGIIPLSVLSITKATTENKVIIMLNNSMPYLRDWVFFGEKELKQILAFKIDRFSDSSKKQSYDFKYTVKFTHDSQSIKKRILQQQSSTDSFDPALYKFIELTIEYNLSTQNYENMESLNHQPTTLKFSPSLSQMQVFSPAQQFSLSFSLFTDENHMIQFYPPEYHGLYSTVKFLSKTVGFTMLIILLISAMSCVVEGNNSRQILLAIETASVVQLTYFSLLGIGELNPLFIALADGLKFACGFDINLSNQHTVNRVLLGVGIQSTNILDNVNVSLVLPFIFTFIGLISLIVSKIKSKKHKNNIPQNSQLMKDQEKSVTPTQRQPQKQCRFFNLSKIFLINFGFGLFLFFLYKYLIMILIQITLSQSEGISFAAISIILILLLSFLLLLFLKFDFFSRLTQKLSSYLSARDKLLMEDPEYSEKLQTQRIKKRKIYFIIIILERIVNSVTLVLFFNSSFKFNGLVPICLSLFQILYFYFYNEEIYNPPNKCRLYFNNVVNCVIQILLLTRKVLFLNDENIIGAEESNYGLYLPLSILLLLSVVEVNALVFLFYSIKKVRCCQLEIEWQKIDQELYQQIKQKKVQKKKLHKNLYSAQKIPNNLAFQIHQTVQQSSNAHFSIKNHSQIFKDKQMKSLNNKLDYSSQKNQKSNSLSLQKMQKQLYFSQPHRNNSKLFQSAYLNQERTQNVLRKNSEQNNQYIYPVKYEDNKLTKNEIKKELKNLLKEMKLPQLKGTIFNRNCLLKIQQKQKNLFKNKKQSYHYTNQEIYNVYQEYDKI